MVVLSVTTVGIFMASLDMSIVVIGLPTVLQDLHASIVHGIWIITGYRLMMTILAVLLGRMADLYGRVKLFNLGSQYLRLVRCFAPCLKPVSSLSFSVFYRVPVPLYSP